MMRIKRLAMGVCVAIIALAIWNNLRYSRTNQETERVEQEQDSICLVRYETLLYTIQTGTHAIDSLVLEHKTADSAILNNQENLLQQIELLIHLDKQILEQNKTQRCSISSTIHTAE